MVHSHEVILPGCKYKGFLISDVGFSISDLSRKLNPGSSRKFFDFGCRINFVEGVAVLNPIATGFGFKCDF